VRENTREVIEASPWAGNPAQDSESSKTMACRSDTARNNSLSDHDTEASNFSSLL
jgi:hypothetical protein